MVQEQPVRVYIHRGGGQLYPTGGEWNHRAFPRATLYSAVLGQLIVNNQDGETLPALVESWEAEPRYKVWNLKLRQGMRFHHGRPVTSEDLAFSFTRHLGCPYDTVEKETLINVNEVQVVDERSVRIVLKNPDVAFVKNLAISELSIAPREELLPDGVSWKRWPVGAGPYKILQASQDEVLLERTDAYPDTLSDSPRLLRIVTDIQDPSVDLVVGTSELPDGLRQRLNAEVIQSVPAHIVSIMFNYRSALGADPRFREAVSRSVLRAELVNQMPHSRSATHLEPPALASGPAPAKEFDQAKVRRLVKEAGLDTKVLEIPRSKALPINFQASLERQFQDAGLQVRFVDQDHKIFDESDHTTPFWIVLWSPDVGDALLIYQLFSAGSPHVPTSHRDERYQELLRLAETEVDLARRAERIRDLAHEFTRLRRVVPLVSVPVTYWSCPKRLKQINDIQQTQSLLFHRIRERR